MSLKADGVYVPVMIRKFKICSLYIDLVHVPRLVDMLYFVRVSIRNGLEVYHFLIFITMVL